MPYIIAWYYFTKKVYLIPKKNAEKLIRNRQLEWYFGRWCICCAGYIIRDNGGEKVME